MKCMIYLIIYLIFILFIIYYLPRLKKKNITYFYLEFKKNLPNNYPG